MLTKRTCKNTWHYTSAEIKEFSELATAAKVLYVTLVPVAYTTLWMLKNEAVTQKLNAVHVNLPNYTSVTCLLIQCMHHLARNADS